MSVKRWRWAVFAAECALALWFVPQATGGQPWTEGWARGGGRERPFPIGTPRQLEDLPAGRFRSQLDALPPAARGRALGWLRSFHFTEADLPSLRADASGAILYACDPAAAEEAVEPEPPSIAGAALPVSPFPPSLVFHSRPGAPNILFINFTGESVSGTAWNIEISRDTIPAVAFSSDSDLATFSDAEQGAIRRIWQRVAEDYAPFNIDVTTERPSSFTSRTAMALITRTTDANGEPNPYSSAAGVAYVNVFAMTQYAVFRPAWIYGDNLAFNDANIAEAASHEIGHNMGLSHDGKTDGAEYYGGHGSGEISWGPLMGAGYGRNVTQWSKGEYYLANNTQDDLATIAGKLSYRADDHGGTPGAATALAISGGTNIAATTPENDPDNAHTANKGVLERSTDVDVFSFVTGSGPVSLTVAPWVTPAGTRGGNLDVWADLYDESGRLLLSDQPPLETAARLRTNLLEGRYFLHVRGSGAGDPLKSPPTGYKAYGSIGQYFVSGSISESTGYVVPPVAELHAADLARAGQAEILFSVVYSDNVAVDISTIDSNDVQVTGPNGYSQLARWVSLDRADNGTPRTATYAITPLGGGAWSPADNGAYLVWMQAGQVSDTESAFVAARQLGQFAVTVPAAIYVANMDTDPGWTLETQWEYGAPAYSSGGPTRGFTGTNIIAYNLRGNYTDRLSARYATTPAIDCSGYASVTLRFRRWLRTRTSDSVSIQASANGTVWTNLWSSSSAVSDTSWQEVQYTVPAGVASSPAVRLRWSLSSNNSKNEIGWNLDDVELLGNGKLDTAPPIPVLSVAHLTLGGSPSHACSVTFDDETAVRLSSLDSEDLIVTGPNAYTNALEFVGADLPADGAPITASYSIPAPGGTWDAADNGAYTIALLEGAVEDTLNNVTPEMVLGHFDVAIPAERPGVLEVMPADVRAAWGTAGGPFSPSSMAYTLTNSGGSTLDWAANPSSGWLTLSVTNGALAAGAAAAVTASFNSEANQLAEGSHTNTIHFSNLTIGSGVFRRIELEVQPFPIQLSGRWLESSSLEVRLAGQPLRAYAIETSADFADWTCVVTNTAGADGTFVYLDSDAAANPGRFYRARLWMPPE